MTTVSPSNGYSLVRRPCLSTFTDCSAIELLCSTTARTIQIAIPVIAFFIFITMTYSYAARKPPNAKDNRAGANLLEERVKLECVGSGSSASSARRQRMTYAKPSNRRHEYIQRIQITTSAVVPRLSDAARLATASAVSGYAMRPASSCARTCSAIGCREDAEARATYTKVLLPRHNVESSSQRYGSPP